MLNFSFTLNEATEIHVICLDDRTETNGDGSHCFSVAGTQNTVSFNLIDCQCA